MPTKNSKMIMKRTQDSNPNKREISMKYIHSCFCNSDFDNQLKKQKKNLTQKYYTFINQNLAFSL